jgi:hypothetical protein
VYARGLAVALPVVALAAAAHAGPEPLTVAALFPRGLAPVDVGATAAGDQDAATCTPCHAGIVDEWAKSQHGRAWTDGIFQREFRNQPLDWCVRCHAPLATGDAASVGPVAAQGVNCAVCHLRDGEMVAAAKREGSPHATRVVEGMNTAAYCAGCHEFNFPVIDQDKQVHAYTAHPMQHTVSEFQSGVRASQPGECLGCHGNTPSRHRFPGAHADGVLQHAIGMELCRSGRDLEIALTNQGAGHAVPTGDLHRHMVLRAWRSNAPEHVFEARIGRLFDAAEDGGKVVSEDTSIRPGERRTWDVPARSLGGGGAEPVNVELRYVYTVDEVALPQNDPGEPTSVTVHRERVSLADVLPCR